MSMHTIGHEYPDRYDPVYCATCRDECDRKAKQVYLGAWRPGDDPETVGWQWQCTSCLSELNQALPGDLLTEQMETEGESNGTV